MLSLRLALADLWHERGLAACFIVALAAIMAPLLVLLGLKTGIVDTMRAQLLEDPRMREISSLGNRTLGEPEIEALRQVPGLVFVVGRTRQLAATATLARADGSQAVTAELIATGPGDPLIAPLAAPLADGEAVLSAAAARRMALGPGDKFRLAVQRRLGEQVEGKALTLTVTGIAPAAAFGREGAFVSVDLLAALEDYRDGRPVPRLGWDGPNTLVLRAFAGFRAVAGGIEAVAPAAARLEALGYTVSTRADEIETVLRLDRNLSAIFLIVAVIGGTGFALSLGASLIGHVARKRGELSLLRFMGLSTGGMAGFPLFQGVAIAILGTGLAVVVFLGAAEVINARFSEGLPGGGALCRLYPPQVAAVAGLALAVAVAASSLAGVRAARVEPGEGVRHG
ncbi:ABC transporter permease [Zavarzinia compransoris]|uniref:Peptide ABC transporter permease n=1 Tax=Zavarzinia compransoris TaxID=1264899 RepID=A0A317DYR8_9PROT|nr:FtsX-like permease family protein [Zavarzinia compransoris]PWR19897.1 peptide ABC transporter permease [Zavarzinia compransoris]TDP44990.1 putative ABC transport system permease protein [Zavarzinia compransoris]